MAWHRDENELLKSDCWSACSVDSWWSGPGCGAAFDMLRGRFTSLKRTHRGRLTWQHGLLTILLHATKCDLVNLANGLELRLRNTARVE